MKSIMTTTACGLIILACALGAQGAPENSPHPKLTGAASLSLACEGNACTKVTLTFDEVKQQYTAKNSSDRLVRVEASNLAGSQQILVGAGKTATLEMKSIVGAYRANYESVSGS